MTRTPASSGSRPARDGDVDGDGRADTLTILRAGTLRVRYSHGGEDDVRFETGNPAFVDVHVLGSADADRDGHAEVFVQTDQGASIGVATMFRYVGGHLRLATLGGKQAALAYGGSTGFLASWACRPAQVPAAALVTSTGPSSAPNIYTLDLRYYRFDQGRASLTELSHRTAGPAALDQLPTVRDAVSGAAGCGSARLTS
ncbi:FG-GAP repeat domain-containing protein [Frankia canadensis]|uniref:FG-GAP repeat domain-containing protein n=1 Tax=Frankia canadensis TaxID=1836972 RepID=UPI001FAEB83B|nr:VCBS repeat-containing protein [Frankia canadensis]